MQHNLVEYCGIIKVDNTKAQDMDFNKNTSNLFAKETNTPFFLTNIRYCRFYRMNFKGFTESFT